MKAFYNEIDPAAAAWLRELKTKPQFRWRVSHSVQKRVASRTQNPNHFRPFAVGNTSPSAIAFATWFMRQVQHTIFAAALTAHRRGRIVLTKSRQIAIRQSLGLRSSAVNGFPIGVARMPVPCDLGDARFTAFIRASSFLVRRWCRKELGAAHPAQSRFVGVFGRESPAKCSAAFRGAKTTVASAMRVFDVTVIAISVRHSGEVQ